MGIPWLNWPDGADERVLLYNGVMREESRAAGVIFSEVWDPTLICGLDCIGADGFHPSDMGHQVIASQIPDVSQYRLFLPNLREGER